MAVTLSTKEVEQLKLLLKNGIDTLSLEVSELQQQQLLKYIELLLHWNKAFNLTAIRDPQQMVIKHLLDSLAVIPVIDHPETVSPMLDVGSGAGIPGIPLAIVKPDWQITCLDSNGKKTRFIQQALLQLGLKGDDAHPRVNVIQSRIEEYQSEHKYNTIISRAFSELSNMVSGCEHLLADHGRLLAMKGLCPEEELAKFEKECGQQHGQKWAVTLKSVDVPFLSESRHLVELTRSE